jgi:Predicted permease
MELNKKNMKRLALLIAFGILLYFCLSNISRFSDFANLVMNIIAPLVLGMAIAFILNVLLRPVENIFFAPLNRRFKKRWPKARRPVGILVTILIVVGIIALIALIFVPELINTVSNLTQNTPTYIDNLQKNLVNLEKKYPFLKNIIGKINIDWTNIGSMLEQYGQNLLSAIVNSTVAVAASAAHALITFILGMVFAVNILVQKEVLKSQVRRILYAYLPQRPADIIVKIVDLTNHAFSNFIVGQCTEACILGSLCFIGMSIFRFPYALFISVLVAFMSLIPIFGAYMSILFGALLILVNNPIQALWFILFFVVLQQIEGNFIYPRVVGSKIGLPAIWVLAAITIGLNSLGIIGMIINIPLCSVLYTILREDVAKRLRQKKMKSNIVELGKK